MFLPWSSFSHHSNTTTTTTTQLAGDFTRYTFIWDGIGTYPYSDYQTFPQLPNTTGNYGGYPNFTANGGVGWNANPDEYTDTNINNTIVRYTSPSRTSIHIVVNPFHPLITTNPPSNDSVTNYRSEISLYPFTTWIPVGTEIWISWSVYYPYLSSILNYTNVAKTNGSNCVLRQWSPIGTDGGPQMDLYVDPAQMTSSQLANLVVFENQAAGVSTYAVNGTYPNGIPLGGGSFAAATLPYGHIVPGVWMDFVEHTIIDDGSLGKGCYQLWVSVPTTGLPVNFGSYNDCQYQNYGGTYLWFNRDATSNGGSFKTTRHSSGSGVCKIGIYNGGPGFHSTSTNSSVNDSYTYQSTFNSLQGNPPNGAQMECYLGPIRMEYNTGTINYGNIYNTILGNYITTYYIDPNGQAHIQP